jgi:hypothetical protein
MFAAALQICSCGGAPHIQLAAKIRSLAGRDAGPSNCSSEGTTARARRDATKRPAAQSRGGRFID